MKFISMVYKDILHNFRDKKAMFLMTVFPILMIIILGTAFSQSFGSNNVIKKVKVAYKATAKEQLTESFVSFTKSIENNIDIQFEEITDEKKAREDVSNGIYDSFVDLTQKDKIQMYINDLRVYNANLVVTVMESFVNKTNLLSQIFIYDPTKANELIPDKDYKPSFITRSSVEAKPAPSSKDYYAITMFTMIILYSINSSAFSIIAERMRRTYERIMCSNVSRISYLLAKVTGVFIITSLQVALVYLFSRYMLQTNWGDYPQYTLLISGSLIFMAVSLGIGLTEGIRNPGVMAAVINMTIPIFVFLAGGYVPLSIFNSQILNTISNISPLKWTNKALMDLIFNNDLSTIPMAVGVNLIIGVVFLSVPIIMIYSRKDVV